MTVYTCIEHSGNVANDYSIIHLHHNIIKNMKFGLTVRGYDVIKANNNVFYMDTQGPNVFYCFCQLNGTQGSAEFYNNICCLDRTLTLGDNGAYLRVNAGGELRYLDYNLIYDLNGGAWPEVAKFYNAGNTDWQDELGVSYGLNDIWDEDPQFVDPDNWDFNLKPQSPCIGTGKPDTNGNPTNMGIDQRQIIGAEVQSVL
jgi:hypothetical protein